MFFNSSNKILKIIAKDENGFIISNNKPVVNYILKIFLEVHTIMI